MQDAGCRMQDAGCSQIVNQLTDVPRVGGWDLHPVPCIRLDGSPRQHEVQCDLGETV